MTTQDRPTSPSSKPSPPSKAPLAAGTEIAMRGIRRWLTVLTGLVGLSLLMSSWSIFLQRGPSSPREWSGSRSHRGGGSPFRKPQESSPGPWGQLEYIPITLSPPLELIPEASPPAARKVAWRFPNISSLQLSSLLLQAGVSESLSATLLSKAEADGAIHGLTIHPARELVLKLSPGDRTALYTVLAGFEENGDQVNAFRFRGKLLEEWVGPISISAETKRLMAPLIYQRGGYLFFADLPSIEDSLPSREERLLVVKMLWREPTFLMRLKVTPESDLESLVNYWGQGGREKDIRPFLEATVNIEGGQWISLINLLPRFARQRLFTYPVPPQAGPELKHNCHWSSFNFFAEEPDDRFCDEAEVVRTLKQDYYRVYGNLQLGDVVLFVKEGEEAIHSAVHIADDVVFTRCGNASSQPWELMKLDNMKTFYPTLKPMDVRFFRRKGM